MFKIIFAFALFLQPVMVPVASAYFTPEETLVNSPITIERKSDRELSAIADAENQKRIERLRNAYTNPPSSSESSFSSAVSSEEPVHGSAPAVPTISVDKATLRALERIVKARQTPVLHAGAPLDEIPVQRVPLTRSGPEGYVTVGIMLGAVAWTLRRARKMETL
ncbi:MAG: hypothetical protein JWM56_1334 [Candidatus Peribacteria bacterium]|nr:hypothetical protein [Candidatus Peribacteria bacterium]